MVVTSSYSLDLEDMHMANSLRSAWIAKNRTWLAQEEFVSWDRALVYAKAAEWRDTFPEERVRITTFKLGPKKKPTTQFVVRRYAHKWS